MSVWRPAEGGRLQFTPRGAYTHELKSVPCGVCMSCRVDKARDWRTRILHEAQCHEANSFITLTFSDEHIPSDWSLSKRTLQLFLKRLRTALEDQGIQIRYFGVGEYGPQTLRPHYHLIIFGYDFPDKRLHKQTGKGHVLYTSEFLSKVWPFGWATIGALTPASAGYCGGYALKKVYGSDARASEHYRRTDPLTGVTWQVEREFALMSRMPGLGAEWYSRFGSDAFPSDFLIVDGKRTSVPKYYWQKFQKEQEKAALLVKLERRGKGKQNPEERTDNRLMTRHESALLKSAHWTRETEDE